MTEMMSGVEDTEDTDSATPSRGVGGSEGSFEPRIVAKRQKRLSGVDELVISLAATGLTTGEIAAHLAEGMC